ncbi:hypothetical protein [Dinoroseobacter sp. S76]|uniref:hypothetical protein n=1 Tax=Dinoroseobacter sp. S76 TaxID=3415124 RepID=UPI003C7C41E0
MEEGRADSAEAPVLLLHIGGPKCGSSALQRYLFHGRRRLAGQGIHYIDREFGIDPDLAMSHNQMMLRLARAGASGLLQTRFTALAARGPDQTYLLSSEVLTTEAGHAAEALRGMDRLFAVRIVQYVRPQVEFLKSAWQQWGLGLSFAAWVDQALTEDRANWARSQALWRDALPEAEIITRLYARDHMPGGDVVADFCSALGWDRVETPHGGLANPSYDDATALALQELERREGLTPLTLVRHCKREGILFPTRSENLVFPPDLQARVTAHYAAGNAALCAQAGFEAATRTRFETPQIAPYTPPDPTRLAEARAAVAERLEGIDLHRLPGRSPQL